MNGNKKKEEKQRVRRDTKSGIQETRLDFCFNIFFRAHRRDSYLNEL